MPVILVIDADPLVRLLIRTILEREGHVARIQDDGSSGMKLFLSESPDVVLCDLFMPERDGLETIRAMRRLHPCLPIVAMSVGMPGLTDFLPHAKALGADDTLHKPITPLRLLRVVSELLCGATQGVGEKGQVRAPTT